MKDEPLEAPLVRRRRVATPSRALPASTYNTERVLRWRLQEAQNQLALVSEELRRTRYMLEHFQQYQDRRLQEAEQVSEEVEKKEEVLQELKADLQRVSVLALTHREAELKGCVAELWSKWSLQGAMPRRPTKELTRGKDPVRHRARKRWQQVSRFVAYSFAKARRAKVGQLFLCYRVKELCEHFQASFEERFGVYEALTSCVRHVEIEQSVREKLSKPKKAAVERTSTTFEELESQMMSSYTDAFEEAGGVHEVQAQLPEVGELLRSYRRPRVHQDLGYEILGLKQLYDVNYRWLPKFEEEVNQLAMYTRATPLLAPLKGYERARAKVLTRYGSDASCLTDVMRASLVYATIAEVYSALVYVLREDQEHPRHDFRVMEVNDRFQFCHEGYRDITLLFEMSGVICEIQMQVKGIQDVKKSGGHKAYRVQREVNELIFEAAVQNSQEDLAELVKTYQVTGQGTTDKNGRSALHYTCQHGALQATRALLAAGSNPWREDDQGVLPFELALKQKHFDTLELTLSAMVRRPPGSRSCLRRLAEQTVPWWCANIVRLHFADEELLKWRRAGELLVQVLEHYEALVLLEPLLVHTAQQGQLATTRALLTAGADQVLQEGGESLLDFGLRNGLVELAKMLVCLQRGDGTPRCCHCHKENLHRHLMLAARQADAAYGRAALAAGADPRAQQAFGVGKRTALMSFAAAGELDLCEELLQARAEVQWIDGSCCSAVHYALAQKRTQVAEFLRAQRASTEVPLKHQSLQDIAHYLLKATQEGCCGAIHRGADSLQNLQFQKKQSDTVQYKEVLRQGFGPSQWTLMHYAVKVLKSADPAGQVCRALLMAKADPRLLDLEGETALHWAAADGHETAYESLLQGAYRAEAEDQTLVAMGRGSEVETNVPELQAHVAETTRVLRRRTWRQKALAPVRCRDEGTTYRLQAGFLAFKHALLCKRLVFSQEEPVTATPSLSTAKTKDLRSQKSMKLGGRRNSLQGKDLVRRPSSAAIDRKPKAGTKPDSGASRWGKAKMLTKSGTKALELPERRASVSSPSSRASSRPVSATSSRGTSISPSHHDSSEGMTPSGGRRMSRQISGGSRPLQGFNRQISPTSASHHDSSEGRMSRQISGGSRPLHGFPRQISNTSDDDRKLRFKDEVEEV